MKRLVIIGAGGHGKVCAEIASLAQIWDEIVFVDQKYPALRQCSRWPVVGHHIDEFPVNETDFFVAIGDNQTRFLIHNGCVAKGFKPAVLVHPSAIISQHSTLGAGSLVCAGAIIGIDSVLGECCIVNTGASVDHDCELEQSVHLSPGVHLAGEVTVGKFSWLGVGAVTKHSVSICSNVILGAGAAVVKDIHEPGVYIGIPSEQVKK